MTGWLHQLRRRQYWVALVALPALAFRLAIPVGFMPGIGADHRLTMQFCHGAAPVPMAGDLPTDGPAAPGQPVPGQHDSPCAFAASAAGAPPPAALVLATAVGSELVAADALPAAPVLPQTFRPQSPRAPPADA